MRLLGRRRGVGSRRVGVGAVMAAALAIAACDSGPSGPGAIVGRAAADALGGVVLEVQGRGIRDFSGRGSTQVYWAPVPERANVHRVILIATEGDEIVFEITVDDRGMDGPTITVLQAARTDNSTISASEVSVRVER